MKIFTIKKKYIYVTGEIARSVMLCGHFRSCLW